VSHFVIATFDLECYSSPNLFYSKQKRKQNSRLQFSKPHPPSQMPNTPHPGKEKITIKPKETNA
jgi:hypothetical protein